MMIIAKSKREVQTGFNCHICHEWIDPHANATKLKCTNCLQTYTVVQPPEIQASQSKVDRVAFSKALIDGLRGQT